MTNDHGHAGASLAGRVSLVLALFLLLGGFLFWAYSAFLKGSGNGEEVAVKKEFADPSDVPIEPKSIVETEYDKKIRAAVEHGAAFLKKSILDEKANFNSLDNRFGEESVVGATALAGLTLLETGTPLSDPALQKVLGIVRKKGKTVTMVYALGATLFLLNRLGDAGALTDEDRELHRTLVLRLVNGQLADGRWTYQNNSLTPEKEKALLTRLQGNTFKPESTGGTPTASMTQFAIMALWGSRRNGMPIRQSFLHASARFQALQLPDGSWSYLGGKERFHDSNTCAGLMALAMEKIIRADRGYVGGTRSTDPPPNPKADEMRDKAVSYLGKVIDRPKDHKMPFGHHHSGNVVRADAWGDIYFLWCLERVAVIYGWETIEGKDWYRWGADNLLANQKSDGSWKDQHGDIPDTCFALLFLRRANLAQDLTEQLRRAS